MKAKYPIQDYNQRLHRGVILWKGVPHCINTEDDTLNITDLVTGEMIARNVSPDHEHLDIAAFELGYVNTEFGAYYLSRIPARQFKQAITAGSVIEYRLISEGIVREGMGRSRWLQSEQFRDRYIKPFPHFDLAINLFDDEKQSVALSPSIAITKNRDKSFTVWYKLEEVGKIKHNTRTVIVPSSEKAWVISMYLSQLNWEVQ